jgi:hypothetical protein
MVTGRKDDKSVQFALAEFVLCSHTRRWFEIDIRPAETGCRLRLLTYLIIDHAVSARMT